MDSVHRKKSVCLKYANVVLLLYDALNLIDNLMALSLWWYPLLRGHSVSCPGTKAVTPSMARLWLRGKGDQCWFLHRLLQFSDLSNARMTTVLSAFLLPGRWQSVHSLSWLATCWINFLPHSSLDLYAEMLVVPQISPFFCCISCGLRCWSFH